MINFYSNLFLPLIFHVMFHHKHNSKTLALKCTDILNSKHDLHAQSQSIIPPLQGRKKGDNGRIGIIGGSIEYTGAPYFAAISALKVGADLVNIITTADAAPIIKTYSPELIVYPFLHDGQHDLEAILKKMDVLIIGPGLGRQSQVLESFMSLISICKRLKKSLIIDADGLFAISKNVTNLLGYPSAILTPNHSEAKHLKEAVQTQGHQGNWFEYWGPGVTILAKGEEDEFHCHFETLSWKNSEGGSGRRAGGQGDILAGGLGTFYSWAMKSNICDDDTTREQQIKQAVASFAAAAFTRKCNEKAFVKHGRSMTASDMLVEIHAAYEALYGSDY